jgi:uncharacterized protein involved in exopolysaccharide biosynthesis
MQEHVTPPSRAAGNEELDFLDYLEIILRRKKMIILVTFFAFVFSIALALNSTKIYRATALILPPQQDQALRAMMLGGVAGGGAGGGLSGLGLLNKVTPADQYASILESERITGAIIDRFKLMDDYKAKYRLDMYYKMQKKVDITAGKKDGIISISVEDKDPKKAADIANAYIEELGKLNVEMSVSDAGLNRGFLEKQLAKAKANLAQAEDATKAFQSKYNAINISDQGRASIEGVAMLKAQLAAQEVQLSATRTQFTDSTQEVESINATINKLKSQIVKLEGVGTGTIPSVGSIPGLAQEHMRLLREFKIQATLVELLTKQNELAKLSEEKNINSIQVIQRAQAPDKKVKPKRVKKVLLTTFLAFALSIAAVIARHHSNKISLETRQRLKNIVHLISPWLATKI